MKTIPHTTLVITIAILALWGGYQYERLRTIKRSIKTNGNDKFVGKMYDMKAGGLILAKTTRKHIPHYYVIFRLSPQQYQRVDGTNWKSFEYIKR